MSAHHTARAAHRPTRERNTSPRLQLSRAADNDLPHDTPPSLRKRVVVAPTSHRGDRLSDTAPANH